MKMLILRLHLAVCGYYCMSKKPCPISSNTHCILINKTSCKHCPRPYVQCTLKKHCFYIIFSKYDVFFKAILSQKSEMDRQLL